MLLTQTAMMMVLTDGLEVKTYGTDPNNEDTDGDGLFDGPEIDAGTDPFDTDSDDDGLTDGEEGERTYFNEPTQRRQ